MRILGIDPGLAETGYGIIQIAGNHIQPVAFGAIKTTSHDATGRRLAVIYDKITELIGSFEPDMASVESLYFAKNITSALPVAQARGIVLLACEKKGLDTGEYPPQAIKQAIVGNGRAEKQQVQELVRLLLGLEKIPEPDHAADALAAAICHFHHLNFNYQLHRVKEKDD